MDNIVDNLQTKDKVTYEDVRARLLDISANESVAGSGTGSKTAYRAHGSEGLEENLFSDPSVIGKGFKSQGEGVVILGINIGTAMKHCANVHL